MRLSALLLGLVLAGVALAPLLTPYDPLQTAPQAQFLPPIPEHPLGTDLFGRDVLSRVLYGGRQTLNTAGMATIAALLLSVVLGMAAGFLRGGTDRVIVLVMNALLAVPGLVVALVVLTVLGRGSGPLIVAVGAAQLPPYVFVIRSAVIQVRAHAYIEAAYSLGAGRLHLVYHHILPGIGPTLLAYAGITFSYAILNSAALTFLGLAGDFSAPDWGVMLAEGRAALRVAPWIGLGPGLAISITIWSINNLVDGITRIDPPLSKRREQRPH
jgi:peptide/nickel transport system permease protein